MNANTNTSRKHKPIRKNDNKTYNSRYKRTGSFRKPAYSSQDGILPVGVLESMQTCTRASRVSQKVMNASFSGAGGSRHGVKIWGTKDKRYEIHFHVDTEQAKPSRPRQLPHPLTKQVIVKPNHTPAFQIAPTSNGQQLTYQPSQN